MAKNYPNKTFSKTVKKPNKPSFQSSPQISSSHPKSSSDKQAQKSHKTNKEGNIKAIRNKYHLPSHTKSLPPVQQDTLKAYLMEVKKYPLLTPEEEKRLAIKYFEEGDRDAASSLVRANLRFVIKIAAEYFKFGPKLIDLIQEGNIGLIHAVKEYNPYKGVRLTSYAVWWIRGYIKEYLLRNYSPVKIATTQSQRKIFYNLQNETKKLELEGFQPTTKLLSQRLDVPEKDVETMKVRMASKPISLDATLDKSGDSHIRLIDMQTGERSEDSLDEFLSSKEELASLKKHIRQIRPFLNEKELYILDKRLLSDPPLTLKEVGDKYGITRERVRQIETRLIQKLRQSFNS